MLREGDSNFRPSGYEPDMLPAALSRDMPPLRLKELKRINIHFNTAKISINIRLCKFYSLFLQ